MSIERETLSSSRILVIDDEPVNVTLIQRTLGYEGFSNVTGMTDPREALNLVANEPIDLVILDLNMPLLDGFAVLENLPGRISGRPVPPVLMLTAQTDRESRVSVGFRR